MATQAEVKNDPKYIPVLDHGFIGLVENMGDDSSIIQAARVSYGKGTKSASTDRVLLRYLLSHSHTTPFEMVEFKFHCKMPIFVARQWIRHRTANVNEYSGRYSEMTDEMYLPELDVIKPQSTDNKQGRSGEMEFVQKVLVRDIIEGNSEAAYAHYQELLGKTAKELARVVLPVSNYTEWYWKNDLHNILHFLKLRIDPHAQYEIRVFGEAMLKLIEPVVPLAIEAFRDYVVGPRNKYTDLKMSTQELRVLQFVCEHIDEDILIEQCTQQKMSKREIDAFLDKVR